MSMDVERLRQKLVRAARITEVDASVPPYFEKRVTARLSVPARPGILPDWSWSLWGAAVSCLAISVLVGAWVTLAPGSDAPELNLAEHLESTVLAAVEIDSLQTETGQ